MAITTSNTGEWDSRLNRLLEDLQETVVSTEPVSRNAQEYREYHVTKRTQINDEPPQTMDEKWVEIGNLVGGGVVDNNNRMLTSPRFESKSVAFADDLFEKRKNMEFLAPANSTTELKSGPSSPNTTTITTTTTSTTPKIERKEFYSKSSYTSMIKSPDNQFPPPSSYTITQTQTPSRILTSSSELDTYDARSSSMETKSYDTRTESKRILGPPLYSSTPIKTYNQQREVINEKISTPPKVGGDPLKTPPMIRKILQTSQNTSSHHHHHHGNQNTSSTQQSMLNQSMMSKESMSQTTTTTTSSTRPPIGGVPLPIIQQHKNTNYDDVPEKLAAKYYTSTVTTEHRERDVSPIRRFPSQQNNQSERVVEAPKRLDELLASFGEENYRSTTYSRESTTNESPQQKPYGPGSTRTVRIDDNNKESELTQRKNITNYQNPSYNTPTEATKNITGPPVFYPPGQIFNNNNKKEEVDEGKGKMKMEKKEKDKSKGKRSEKGGEGAVPVPVCLPVCCAAPCSIM